MDETQGRKGGKEEKGRERMGGEKMRKETALLLGEKIHSETKDWFLKDIPEPF